MPATGQAAQAQITRPSAASPSGVTPTYQKSWLFLKGVVNGFLADDAFSLSAAIAFYTALSFAPLVLLLLTIGGLFGDRTQNDLLRLFEQQLGPRAADVTAEVVRHAQSREGQSRTRWIVATSLLVITASGVFGQLQASLNRVWEVESKPHKGWRAAWMWLRKRLLSMGMVMAILFILLASLLISTLTQWLVPRLGAGTALASAAAVHIVSFVVAMLVFAAMFKFLPDVRVQWRQVWTGALATAGLFTLGKFILSLYLREGGVGEDYGGATGGLIALLVWVYYSSATVLLGAEITQRAANFIGQPPAPMPHAQWVGGAERAAAPK